MADSNSKTAKVIINWDTNFVRARVVITLRNQPSCYGTTSPRVEETSCAIRACHTERLLKTRARFLMRDEVNLRSHRERSSGWLGGGRNAVEPSPWNYQRRIGIAEDVRQPRSSVNGVPLRTIITGRPVGV